MPSVDSLKHYSAPSQWSYDVPAVADTTSAGNIKTVLIDSIAADTVEGRIPHFVSVATADSLRSEAFADSMAAYATVVEIPSGAREGIVPQVREAHYSHSTALTGLLMGVLVLAGLNSGGVIRALKSYRHDLWSVRRRPNVFDEEQSVGAPIAVILALVFIVFGGIAGYNFPSLPVAPSFAGATASMAVTGVFFIFHYLAYSLTGYAFGSSSQRRRWVEGFLAAMAYAGLFMIIPGFLLVFRPEWHIECVTISLVVYLLAKLVFIIKGVRIFFLNFRSLLYFILYLCTLEIIPALAYYRICVYLQGLLF